jgi:bifunctional non-homologous end joining protein LigD
MLSGGKGVHVIVPLIARSPWATVKDFAHRFAEAVSAAHPERYTATMSKARRKGRIFIDWLRNQRGATSVAPYSARARPGAPVAAPVTWRQLRTTEAATRFTVHDGKALLTRANSAAMRGWLPAPQSLPDA